MVEIIQRLQAVSWVRSHAGQAGAVGSAAVLFEVPIKQIREDLQFLEEYDKLFGRDIYYGNKEEI